MGKPIPLVRAPLVQSSPAPAREDGSSASAPPKRTVARFCPRAGDALQVLEAAVDHARRGIRGVMATVVARHGSAPGTPGQKLYAAADGACIGTVGGGAVEREVLAAMEAMLADGHRKHHLRSFKLGAELGMCCGGSVEVLLEPLEALVPLLIVGGGHVATACAPLLAKVGFTVTVVDAREAWGEPGRIEAGASPGSLTCVMGDYDDVAREMPQHGAVLVMTHDHALDQEVIEWALGRCFAYVGGVGSRAKAQRTRDRLVHKGFSEADCARVRMPIGVDIGARLPDEIAVSITAEMVAWRRSIQTR